MIDQNNNVYYNRDLVLEVHDKECKTIRKEEMNIKILTKSNPKSRILNEFRVVLSMDYDIFMLADYIMTLENYTKFAYSQGLDIEFPEFLEEITSIFDNCQVEDSTSKVVCETDKTEIILNFYEKVSFKEVLLFSFNLAYADQEISFSNANVRFRDIQKDLRNEGFKLKTVIKLLNEQNPLLLQALFEGN